MKFKSIKQFPNIHYRVDIPLDYLPNKIKQDIKELNLQLNPDFQRGHVWTRNQQIKYMEFLFKNPTTGKEFYFNHPGWMNSWKGDYVLVDGLQRLTAILNFLDNTIPVYNSFYKEYEDRIPVDISVSFHIARLQTKKEVLQWYLDFNSAGTIHSKKELTRIKQLINQLTKE